MKNKKTKVICLLAAAALTASLAGCQEKEAGQAKEITVGSKGFTENLILSELYALSLEDAGFKVNREFEISNAVIHTSIESGEIDVYPEYTGTALLTILGEPLMTDPEKVYEKVKKQYKEKYKLDVLDLCKANDGNSLVIRTEAADQYDIKTISDLQEKAGNIRFGSTSDFSEREDGMPALTAAYGEFHFKSENAFDNALKYQIMSSDEVDCVPAYTTDAQLSLDEYTLLEDDKQVWPPYNVIPVVREEITEKYPEAAEAINKISASLDTETLTGLNAKVDLEKQEYDEAAKEFYDSL